MSSSRPCAVTTTASSSVGESAGCGAAACALSACASASWAKAGACASSAAMIAAASGAWRWCHRPCGVRSEEHTSELQSLMRNPYAVFCLKKKKKDKERTHTYMLKRVEYQNTYKNTPE